MSKMTVLMAFDAYIVLSKRKEEEGKFYFQRAGWDIEIKHETDGMNSYFPIYI